jgi:uncharacterized protein YraI
MRRLLAVSAVCLGFAAPALADPAETIAPATMRAAPSASARVVQHIPANAEIDLSSCSGAWCYVSWRDRFGYVRADAVAARPYAPRPGYYDYGPGYYWGPPVVVAPGWGWGRPYGWGWRRW